MPNFFLDEFINKDKEISLDGASAGPNPSSAPQTPLTPPSINKVLHNYRIISDDRFVVGMTQINGAYVLFDELFKEKSNILEYLKASFIISLSKNHFILEPSIFNTSTDAYKYLENKESDWKMASWITSLGLTKKDLSDDKQFGLKKLLAYSIICLLYTSPSPRDRTRSRMPSSA